MSSRTYVYISYSKRDAPFVRRLVADLQRAGIPVWLDDAEIPAGSNWSRELASGITKAAVMLYISSIHCTTSALSEDLRTARESKKPIVTILADEAGERTLPVFLRVSRCADFRKNYSTGLSETIAALKVYVRSGSPVEPKPQKSKGYVFISYAHEDEQFVAEVREFLKGRGYSYWDYDKSNRNYQEHIPRELEGVIKDASVSLCVLSEAWRKSDWTLKEYLFCKAVETPVFLLRAEVISPTLAIEGIPFIDFVSDRARGFERLDRELRLKSL
jgi:hypothetical protein